MAARTKMDWSNSSFRLSAGGSVDRMRGSICLMLLHDVERGSTAVLEHRQQRAARAVVPHDVGLHRVAVAHVSHIADVDRGRRWPGGPAGG